MTIELDNPNSLAGSKEWNEPRLLGEILREMAEQDNELGCALRLALQCRTINKRKEESENE